MLTLDRSTLNETTFHWEFEKTVFKYRLTYKGSPMLLSYARDHDGNIITQIIQEGINPVCDCVFDMDIFDITFTDMAHIPFTAFEVLEIDIIPIQS